MKSEWKEYTLDEVCERIFSGGTPSTMHSEYWNGTLKWLSSGETSQRFIYDTERKITEIGVKNSSTKLATKGCTVIATAGQGFTRGQASFLMTDTFLNQSVIACKANERFVLPLFLYYNLDNRYEEFRLLSDGTSTRGGLSGWILKRMTILLPPLDEQKKIVDILEKIDRKIEVNNAINHNLQQQAAAIFAEWLNTCTDYSTIGDMSHNILDYSPLANEQIRLLNSSDITEGVFPVAPLVPNKGLKGHFKKRFKFGDILYSEIRPRNHHYGFVLFDASNYIASTRLMVIRAIENKVSPAMLYQYLLLPEVEAEFTAKTESRSGTFPQGNYADMASIQVPYSSIDSQATVSETLSQIRYTIAHNQLESQRLAEVRDALLPKLMSGEIDVSDIQL